MVLCSVSPTDDELNKVLDVIPLWNDLTLALGVPRNQAKAFIREESSYKMAGFDSLCFWRNGKCGVAEYPPTRRFLLDTVNKTEGPYYAIKVKNIFHPPVPEPPGVIVPPNIPVQPSSNTTFIAVMLIVVLSLLFFPLLVLLGSCLESKSSGIGGMLVTLNTVTYIYILAYLRNMCKLPLYIYNHHKYGFTIIVLIWCVPNLVCADWPPLLMLFKQIWQQGDDISNKTLSTAVFHHMISIWGRHRCSGQCISSIEVLSWHVLNDV